MTCAFCVDKSLNDRLIASNDLVKAFPSSEPIVPGHTLIIPTRCIATFEDLTFEERTALFSMMETVKLALKKSFSCGGFNHAWNESLVAGQSVPHFHLHIVPRIEGDAGIHAFEPREFLYRPGSRATSPNEELIALAKLVKNNL